jgi:hypothetical protein
MTDDSAQAESLLPYAQWTEEALRVVVADVLAATGVIISLFALGRTGRVFDRFAELVHAGEV